MKTPKLDREQVAKWLNQQSDHDFIALFYEHLSSRHVFYAERRYTEAHLVLAVARRDKDDDKTRGPWRTEMLCPTPGQTWVKDAPVCQFGHCRVCDHDIASWSISPTCAVCGSPCSAT